MQFQIRDSRLGDQFEFRFGRRSIYVPGDEHHVILTARGRGAVEGGGDVELIVELIAECTHSPAILLRVGPPMCKLDDSVAVPPDWRVRDRSHRSISLEIPASAMRSLAGFFDRWSSYEQWLFYFMRDPLGEKTALSPPRYLDKALITSANIPWRAIVWYDGDSRSTMVILPFGESCRDTVETVLRRGLAFREDSE